MNILLIGLRGTGKSRISEQLARLICLKHIDLDIAIENDEKLSIAEIVEKKGWDYFRTKEHEKVADILPNVDGYVIATGGGAPVQPNNVKYFENPNNVVVLLEADSEVLARRVEESELATYSRPALTTHKNHLEEMRAMHKERRATYLELADIVIDVSDQSAEKEVDVTNKALKIAVEIARLGIRDQKLMATVGMPICHSKSTLIHTTGILHHGLDATFGLLNLATEQSLGYLKTLGFHGLSVTHPFKEDIIPLLDVVSPEVKLIGACNTVLNKNGKWHGYNTDYLGVTEALRRLLVLSGDRSDSFKDKQVVLVGAGGAAKAVAYALHKLECDVIVVNRTVAKAEQLARMYGFDYAKYNHFNELEYDILINATSVGAPVPLEHLKEGKIVLDINYQNGDTELLVHAKAKNCVTMNGLPMLLFQGAAQFTIWLNKELPIELVAKKLGIGEII